MVGALEKLESEVRAGPKEIILSSSSGFVISNGWRLDAVQDCSSHLDGGLRPLQLLRDRVLVVVRSPTFSVICTSHAEEFEVT